MTRFKGKSGYTLRELTGGIHRWKRDHVSRETQPAGQASMKVDELHNRFMLGLPGRTGYRGVWGDREPGEDPRFPHEDEARATGLEMMGGSTQPFVDEMFRRIYEGRDPRSQQHAWEGELYTRNRNIIGINGKRRNWHADGMLDRMFATAGYPPEMLDWLSAPQRDYEASDRIHQALFDRIKRGETELAGSVDRYWPLAAAGMAHSGHQWRVDMLADWLPHVVQRESSLAHMQGSYDAARRIGVGLSVLAGARMDDPASMAAVSGVHSTVLHELTHAVAHARYPFNQLGTGWEGPMGGLYRRAQRDAQRVTGRDGPTGSLVSSHPDDNPFYHRLGYILPVGGDGHLAPLDDPRFQLTEAPTVLTEMGHFTPEALHALDDHYGTDYVGHVNDFWGFNMVRKPNAAGYQDHREWLERYDRVVRDGPEWRRLDQEEHEALYGGKKQSSVVTPDRIVDRHITPFGKMLAGDREEVGRSFAAPAFKGKAGYRLEQLSSGIHRWKRSGRDERQAQINRPELFQNVVGPVEVEHGTSGAILPTYEATLGLDRSSPRIRALRHAQPLFVETIEAMHDYAATRETRRREGLEMARNALQLTGIPTDPMDPYRALHTRNFRQKPLELMAHDLDRIRQARTNGDDETAGDIYRAQAISQYMPRNVIMHKMEDLAEQLREFRQSGGKMPEHDRYLTANLRDQFDFQGVSHFGSDHYHTLQHKVVPLSLKFDPDDVIDEWDADNHEGSAAAFLLHALDKHGPEYIYDGLTAFGTGLHGNDPEVRFVVPSTDYMDISVELGNNITMSRSLNPMAREVSHESFFIGSGNKAKGVGGQLIKSQLALWETLGMDTVTVTAADDGPLVWPRFGFIPDDPIDNQAVAVNAIAQYARYVPSRENTRRLLEEEGHDPDKDWAGGVMEQYRRDDFDEARMLAVGGLSTALREKRNPLDFLEQRSTERDTHLLKTLKDERPVLYQTLHQMGGQLREEDFERMLQAGITRAFRDQLGHHPTMTHSLGQRPRMDWDGDTFDPEDAYSVRSLGGIFVDHGIHPDPDDEHDENDYD